MEKYRKKDMLEAVDLLFNVNDSIMRNAKVNKKEDIIEALSQCQDVALALGNYLESLGEIGDGFVHILEDYCENLYQMSMLFSNENLCRKLSKKIKKQLSFLKTGISLELPDDKIEMVFLPYKVSMWDSLESVWRAATEDQECEAFVMPIPYFEKNAKGELAIEHYEGDQFPESVPIVDYENYDLMERKPDVVFIHNPYDQYNYVTSIHPSYYIPELKKCGCKVVYIPYYISAEVNPDSIEVQKGREGYIVTPGVLYSDMVFVQSENVKRLFVNVLERRVFDVGRYYWEKRIFGLGSPKLERVHSVKRNDTLLPERWKKIIYTEEGIRKKVVLYNISINALLNTPEMLDKIIDVLCFFKKSKDVALWWRPHPLYESTIISMRPDLLEKYKEIVRKYREEGWGIFDKGVDLEWAIAETDAYYGDSSSVVQLYKEVQKPVMIQNTLVKAEKSITAEDIPIWPSAFYVDGDDIWFIHGKMNVLMRYNISESYTYVIDRIPNENLFQERAYIGIYKWKNKLFMIPSSARDIVLYNITEKRFERISIPNIEEYEGKGLFYNIYAEKRYLYGIPFLYEAIIKLDMENNSIEYIHIKGMNKSYINGTTRVGDELIAIYAYTNQAVFFDIKTGNMSLKSLGEVERKYTDIGHIGNKLYLFDEYSGCIIQKSMEGQKEEEEFCKYSNKNVRIFSALSDFLILDSVESNGMELINKEKEVVFQTQNMQKLKIESLYSIYCSGIESNNSLISDSFFYFSRDSYSMLQFGKDGLQNQFVMRLVDQEYKKIKKVLFSVENNESSENDIYNIVTWIKNLYSWKEQKEKFQYSCGEKVLQVVKENIL